VSSKLQNTNYLVLQKRVYVILKKGKIDYFWTSTNKYILNEIIFQQKKHQFNKLKKRVYSSIERVNVILHNITKTIFYFIVHFFQFKKEVFVYG
jgi:hypothetical protein